MPSGARFWIGMAAVYVAGAWLLLRWADQGGISRQQLRDIVVWIPFVGAFGAWLRWRRQRSVVASARWAALGGVFGAAGAAAVVVLLVPR